MNGEVLAPLGEPMTAAALPLSAYVAVGAELINFVVDQDSGVLERRGAARLPSRVQYAWPHPSAPVIYSACADRSATSGEPPFFLCALLRDANGNCTELGISARLPARPIHLTVTADGRFALVAYSQPALVTVHRLNADGSVGEQVVQEAALEFGSHPHQVLMTPDGSHMILSARGKKGFGKETYVSGSLEVFSFGDGQLRNVQRIVPDVTAAPRGFNPRAVDFHPELPLLYVALEEQCQLAVFARDGNLIAPGVLHLEEALADPAGRRPRQDGGAIHIHPDGRAVYVGNRNDGYVGGMAGPSWLTPDPVPVFGGGENSVAVFRLDGAGAPHKVQNAPSGGLHPRSFALTPNGKWLIVANLAPTIIEQDGGLVDIPANLTVCAVAEDGQLAAVSRHDIDVAGEMVWWMGLAR